LDRDRRLLDHGYLVLFEQARSFTGESSAECWVHGSPAVLEELVAVATAEGAMPAAPGEFTYRALRIGRLDLASAAAIRALIEARTRLQARVAIAQAEGALSRRLEPLRLVLEEWIARGEAAVEFVDEAETHLPEGVLAAAIDRAVADCESLLSGFETGRLVRDGATLAIVGCPNAGKSSLFNRLLDRERAIVHETAGTTRDTLEEQVDIAGIPMRLIDTAGLRRAADEIESEGVRRASLARAEADFELLVIDGTSELSPEERRELHALDTGQTRTVVVVNKCDLETAASRPLPISEALRVSARSGAGIETLRRVLTERLVGTGPLEDPILTNRRHAIALVQARDALQRAAVAVSDRLSEELVLEDLRQAMRCLGEITGEFTSDALYDKIFSTFCIGK
jgi:tRNA modification GTPase